jgi:hypothetical protein
MHVSNFLLFHKDAIALVRNSCFDRAIFRVKTLVSVEGLLHVFEEIVGAKLGDLLARYMRQKISKFRPQPMLESRRNLPRPKLVF